MTTEESAARRSQLMAGVREDGTVEGHMIETYIAHILAMKWPQQYGYGVDHANKFISFTVGGGGGVDQEVRLPFELVDAMKKWIDAGPKKDEPAIG